MKMLMEFREFALKGNVVDLAVGVIIGAAFGKIVGSLVEDIIMPPIGKLIGNVDFTNLYVSLSDKIDAANSSRATTQPGADSMANVFSSVARLPLAEARKLGPVIAYGNFLTILLNFIIVAFCIFAIVKMINSARRKPEPAPNVPPAPTRQETLLEEIRDSIRSKSV